MTYLRQINSKQIRKGKGIKISNKSKTNVQSLLHLFCHFILMGVIHVYHRMSLDRNINKNIKNWLQTNMISAKFWVELFLNSFGCLLISCNIKCCAKTGEAGDAQARVHEKTFNRYLLMDLFILSESVALILLSTWNGNTNSRIDAIYCTASDAVPGVTVALPLMVMIGMVIKLFYYKNHQWPIRSKPKWGVFWPAQDEEQLPLLEAGKLINYLPNPHDERGNVLYFVTFTVTFLFATQIILY